MELKFCAKSCFHWWKSIRDDNDVLCHLLEYYCPIVSQLLQVQFSIYCCVWTSNFDGIKWERCIAQFISASQHSAVVENDKVINNFVNVYGAQSPITIPVTRFWTRETSVANNNNNQAQQSLSYRLVSKVDFHGFSSQFASSSKRRNRCELFVMKLVHL